MSAKQRIEGETGTLDKGGTSVLYTCLIGSEEVDGGEDFAAYLPNGRRPGRWTPNRHPGTHETGYMFCDRPRDLIEHLGSEMYEVEVRGATEYTVSGVNVAGSMRLVRRVPTWNEKTQRLFAVDCARIAVNRHGAPGHRPALHRLLDEVVEATKAGRRPPRCAAWKAAMKAAGFPDQDTPRSFRDVSGEDWIKAQDNRVDDATFSAALAALVTTEDDAWRAAEGASIDAADAAGMAKLGHKLPYDETDERILAAMSYAYPEQGELLDRYVGNEEGPFVEATL